MTRQDSFDIHPDHWFSLSAARGWRDFWILPLGTPRLAIPSLCFTSTGVPASINGAAYVSLARYRHARAAGFYKGSRNCRATGSCGAFRACRSKGRARRPVYHFVYHCNREGPLGDATISFRAKNKPADLAGFSG